MEFFRWYNCYVALLRDSFPELYAELVTKDESLTHGSARPVEWKCLRGHIYVTSPNKRTSMSVDCKYCNRRRPYVGETDLQTVFPEVFSSLKDKTLILSPYSAKKVEWVCRSGHEWTSTVRNRVRPSSGCPSCLYADGASLGEREVLAFVTGFAAHEVVTNSRSVIPPMELDIYVPDISRAIEYNGRYWHQDLSREQRKLNLCREAGIDLMVVRDDEWKEEQSRIKQELRVFLR